jgi:hypothetical protein
MVRIWAAYINEYLPYVKSFVGCVVVREPIEGGQYVSQCRIISLSAIPIACTSVVVVGSAAKSAILTNRAKHRCSRTDTVDILAKVASSLLAGETHSSPLNPESVSLSCSSYNKT